MTFSLGRACRKGCQTSCGCDFEPPSSREIENAKQLATLHHAGEQTIIWQAMKRIKELESENRGLREKVKAQAETIRRYQAQDDKPFDCNLTDARFSSLARMINSVK